MAWVPGNGDFYVCLSERQSVSAWQKETRQTHVFVLSRSLLLNHLEPQSSKTKLLLPIMPIGIVAYTFTLSWDNLCRNTCISFSPNGIFNLRFSQLVQYTFTKKGKNSPVQKMWEITPSVLLESRVAWKQTQVLLSKNILPV